jgi:hypothetical protein
MIDDLIIYFTAKAEKEWSREVAEVAKISELIKAYLV